MKEQDEKVVAAEAAATEETAASTEKKSRKKELTAEEIQSIIAAADTVEAMGVSAEFGRLLTLARAWNSKESLDEAKQACIDAFGGSSALKDYLAGEFQNDIANLAGVARLVTTLNSINSFYARRKATKKVKRVVVKIKGNIYEVNKEAYESSKSMSPDERREYLLNHEDTITSSVDEF